MNDQVDPDLKWFVSRVALAIALLAALLLAGCPTYNVWKREMAGKAALREATWNRQIAVEEARARLESDSMNAAAEIVRARGLAAAADTVINKLGSTEAYIQYLWIQRVAGSDGERIYIATEAGLPILEASSMPPRPTPPPQ